MKVEIIEREKLKLESLMLSISPGVKQSEMFPVGKENQPGEWQRFYEFDVLDVDPCCRMIEKAIDSEVIVFASNMGEYSMEDLVYDTDGSYEYTNKYYMKYCPFCGTKINYEVVKKTKEHPIIEDYSYKAVKLIKEPEYEEITVTRKIYKGAIIEIVDNRL
jgi:hypothetical protein